MNADEYIKKRVDDQIDWYDTKSWRAQFKFKFLRVTEIICAGAIPLISGFHLFSENTALVVGFLGGLIAICASLIGILHYQENWVKFRTTCESLKRAKYLYVTGSAPFNKDDSFELLVRCVESLISQENSDWLQRVGARGEREKVPG